MADREISAREAVSDIRSGMDEAALMKKYKLSQSGLRDLLIKLTELGLLETDKEGKLQAPKKKIRVKEFLRDFRSGKADTELMTKYDISSTGLYILYRKLIELKAIDENELYGDTQLKPGAIDPVNVREMERYCLDFELSVIEAPFPGNKGTVRDITEKGLGLVGITCSKGDRKVLMISPDKFMDIESFVCRAECMWADYDVNSMSISSGFKINEISSPDLSRLRKLIGAISFCEIT